MGSTEIKESPTERPNEKEIKELMNYLDEEFAFYMEGMVFPHIQRIRENPNHKGSIPPVYIKKLEVDKNKLKKFLDRMSEQQKGGYEGDFFSETLGIIESYLEEIEIRLAQNVVKKDLSEVESEVEQAEVIDAPYVLKQRLVYPDGEPVPGLDVLYYGERKTTDKDGFVTFSFGLSEEDDPGRIISQLQVASPGSSIKVSDVLIRIEDSPLTLKDIEIPRPKKVEFVIIGENLDGTIDPENKVDCDVFVKPMFVDNRKKVTSKESGVYSVELPLGQTDFIIKPREYNIGMPEGMTTEAMYERTVRSSFDLNEDMLKGDPQEFIMYVDRARIFDELYNQESKPWKEIITIAEMIKDKEHRDWLLCRYYYAMAKDQTNKVAEAKEAYWEVIKNDVSRIYPVSVIAFANMTRPDEELDYVGNREMRRIITDLLIGLNSYQSGLSKVNRSRIPELLRKWREY